jgi:hypothetical protein
VLFGPAARDRSRVAVLFAEKPAANHELLWLPRARKARAANAGQDFLASAWHGIHSVGMKNGKATE